TRLETEMPVGELRGHPAARRALDVTLLDQVGLDHVLDGTAFLAHRRRQAVGADRTTVELLDDGQEQAAVHVVEAVAIDAEHVQGLPRHRLVHTTVSLHLAVIPYAAQQAIGDTRCTPGAPG